MTSDVLEGATRCVLARPGGRWPQLWPTACWSDGAGLWLAPWPLTVPPHQEDGRPSCAVYVPPVGPGLPGVVAGGVLRAYGLASPLRLALHGPTVSAALAALAARSPAQVLGEGPLRPRRWLRRAPLVLRLVPDDVREVDPPDPGPGVAPALPTAVPADVRRAVAGVRAVTAAFEQGGRLRVAPGVWSAGFALSFPPTLSPPPGAAVTLVPDAADRHARLGVAVHGRMGSDRTVEPVQLTVRRQARTHAVAVDAPVVGGVALPD